MEWKTPMPYHAKTGDRRERRFFFLWPKSVHGITYWLTRRTVTEQFHSWRALTYSGWDIIKVGPASDGWRPY